MPYEMDFLQVGEKARGGDAIAVRFGDLSNSNRQNVIVIDCGFGPNTADQMVRLLRETYHTERVDMVISTHPDLDHIGGLETILDKFQGAIGQLVMHLPWKHHEAAIRLIEDNRVTPHSIRNRLRMSLDAAVSLEKKALSHNVPIVEPFAGVIWEMTGGNVEVVGPNEDFYESLLPHFDGMPIYGGNQYPLTEFRTPPNFTPGRDAWELELASLSDNSWTSAKNNTSVILQITVDERRLLFTGDAGIQALNEAAHYLVASDADRLPLQMIQIPHHGSRNNVGPTVLNNIVGPIAPYNQRRDMIAIVSCPPDGAPRFPNQRVLNAFTRRGARCFQTNEGNFRHSFMAPQRAGLYALVPYKFQEWVQDPDD